MSAPLDPWIAFGIEERTFLHDLASPIGTAMLLAGLMVETLAEGSLTKEQQLAQAQKILKLAEALRDLVEKRRAVLVSRGVPSPKV